ncbi:hypothetical protein KI387_038403, partial [Taxus chinensis]
TRLLTRLDVFHRMQFDGKLISEAFPAYWKGATIRALEQGMNIHRGAGTLSLQTFGPDGS